MLLTLSDTGGGTAAPLVTIPTGQAGQPNRRISKTMLATAPTPISNRKMADSKVNEIG
jgi:hypothetical protein